VKEPNNFGLTVRFRGVRGSIPSPGRETARYGGNTSCVELRCEGRLLILDAGSGIRSLGNDLVRESNGEAIQADVLISHAHWDHIQGFPFFAPAYSDGNRIRVLWSKRVTPELSTALRGQMQSLHFPVGFDQMRGLVGIQEFEREPVDLGPYTVRTIALNHPGGCAGFRIETAYGGVAYIPDHEPFRIGGNNGEADHGKIHRREELINFVSGTDLLILDTQYTEEEYLQHIGWGHGCLPDSVALAANAGVGQLALFHHDPSHRDYQIDLMVQSAQKLSTANSPKIFAATEMDSIFFPRQEVKRFSSPTENGAVAAGCSGGVDLDRR